MTTTLTDTVTTHIRHTIDLPQQPSVQPGTYVALPSLDGITESLNGTLGQIFLCGFAIGMVVAFFKKEWGWMITASLGAIVIAAILWVPDSVKTTFTDVAKRVFGGGA